MRPNFAWICVVVIALASIMVFASYDEAEARIDRAYCYPKVTRDASEIAINYNHPATAESHKHWYRITTTVHYRYCFETNRKNWFNPKRGAGHVYATHRTEGCGGGEARGCWHGDHPAPGKVDCQELQGVSHRLILKDTHDGTYTKHRRGPWTWTDECRRGHSFGSHGKMRARPKLHPYPRVGGTAAMEDYVTFKRENWPDNNRWHRETLNSRIYARSLPVPDNSVRVNLNEGLDSTR